MGVKVAIIGAGYTAGEHARAFRSLDGVTLSGIQSRTRARAEALAAETGIERVCDSIEELYDHSRADLVVVTVPELEMHRVSRAVFPFPWAVLLEKPAGYDLRTAEDIAEEGRRRGGRVFVALNRRMYSATRAALDDLSSNAGARYVRVQDQQDQAAALAAGQPPLVVQNWMFANSVHVVDYLRVFCRGRVSAVEKVIPWNPANPGVVVSKVSFDSGDAGLYEGIWNGPGPWAATVSTPSKRWEMRPLEQASWQARGERVLNAVAISADDVGFKPGFRMQAAQAVAAVRGENTILPGVDDALETMRLVQSIFF